MVCKYDIIDEGGRKRVRALRHFTVQGRDVCPMELGGYVYDEKTLSQEGNCWIFSGSLEYPGVRVMDEAIVDMGNNLPRRSARPKATIISGNSRIMGAISFETQSLETAQTPAMFEQGTYNVVVGGAPIKANASNRVRIPVPLFAGTVGKVAITGTAYEARLISLNEAGIIVSASAWTVGGPAVTLTSTAPYILVEVRKVGETEISPADITTAGVSLRTVLETQINVFNSSIVPVYDGVPAVSSIMRILSVSTGSLFNCSMRVECVYNKVNSLLFGSDAVKTNFFLVLSGGTQLAIRGFKLRNTNFYSREPLPIVGPQGNVAFDVSDCPAFTYDPGTFPDVANFLRSGKTFYFKNCNMPAGSAIHYYDPKVNVWDNIDFTKAMADLGKTAFANTTIVSSNVQGMYRARGNTSGVIGGLLEAASSFDGATYSGVPGATYDSIIYKDCVIKGAFEIKGCNVFGGTLGGASRITNTSATAMVVDGSFRIEGNAQVTDTSLKGTGYIGGNAELKNGVVEGYIYMDGNAKCIPEAVALTPVFRKLVMTDNSSYLIHRTVSGTAPLLNSVILRDNAVVGAPIAVAGGSLEMRDNASIGGTGLALVVSGVFRMQDNASIGGLAQVNTYGDVTLIGACTFDRTVATQFNRYGKLVLSNDKDVVDLPPTKITW